ncbi:MAG: hypothetical protein JNK72_17610 [Myxococcales bacterium]|nr:hypothetical protein [Myxococcales bacterium]
MKRVVSAMVLLGCGRTVSPTTADAGPSDSAVVRDAPPPADAPRPIVATPPRSRLGMAGSAPCVLRGNTVRCGGRVSIPGNEITLEGSITSLYCGVGYVALRDDGRFWIWGNTEQALGFSSATTQVNEPRLGNFENILSFDGNPIQLCVSSARQTMCWGYAPIIPRIPRTLPGPVEVPFSVETVHRVIGWQHLCGLTAEGRVYCRGNNSIGQCAQPLSVETVTVPTEVSLPLPAVRLSVGAFRTCAILQDRSLYCWSSSSNERRADGTLIEDTAPRLWQSLGEVVDVSSGIVTCAVKRDGTVWCWGARRYGHLGDAVNIEPPDLDLPNAYALEPVQIEGITDAIEVAHGGGGVSCALRRDNAVWCWGRDLNYQLPWPQGQPQRPREVLAPW